MLAVDQMCQLHQWWLWREEHLLRASSCLNSSTSSSSSSGGGGGSSGGGGVSSGGGGVSSGEADDACSVVDISSHWLELPEELSQTCREAFESRDATASNFQLAVRDCLQSMGMEPQEEVCTPQGYSVDLVVELGGRRVAVEVDGPSHYLGSSRMPNGATMLKRRQLEAFGWRLVSVPYWEWSPLWVKRVEERHKRCRPYLRRKLDEALDEASVGGMRGAAAPSRLPSDAAAKAEVDGTETDGDQPGPAEPRRSTAQLTDERLDAIARRLAQGGW
eukprot:4345420-Prymnesium_polylepis.1